MCKVNGATDIIKWVDHVQEASDKAAKDARNTYDTFLESCLAPWGINKFNACNHLNRIRIEEEKRDDRNDPTDPRMTYQRFYIDGEYEFTVVFKQQPINEGGYITGMITTYKKVVEQDRVPNDMPNEEVINTLKCLMNSTPESATSKRDKALNKAIAALEEQDKYQWIFACVNDPKWDSLFEKVEKALGFKLFYWQKTYILRLGYRRSGETTAMVLKKLLDTEAEPIDFSRPTRNKKSDFFRKDLMRIKEKLDKAGIKTREVWHSKAERDAWYKERSTENIQTSIDSTVSQNRSRNYSGLFDTEN